MSRDEANENENENELESSSHSLNAQFLIPRSPLNTITDPTQFQSTEFADTIAKECNRSLNRKRIEVGGGSSSYVTPGSRVFGRSSAAAQRSGRFSLGAAGGRGAVMAYGSSSGCNRVNPRAGTVSLSENGELSSEVPCFDLVENAAFWSDNNVQVLIRIRPLNTMEKVSQGFARCLRQESEQTLVWLGHPETRFTFDHIACETISQEKLFKVAGMPMVENCMSGYNSCMFAYGQTGSGKTYTMMGEIHEVVQGKIREDCGITARMFEYLFSRIKMEEESKRDEKLKFRCKCSFLEIYNEQITDLLEPSSSNLQLREDMKRGVYVENLSEHDVRNVTDVIELLLQGAANRKMAATNMNSESSRSHSVFNCIIESQWEKDSVTHFRFSRLNLVDLAGSERQKSSGAEGDRLKEAANINKSLSTLGWVIMSLVDLAHGKHRHVPYRDSRLTFLLQDSLGGNSKTAIIANVSPSSSSANETLSTLKFAQRAKLIQNNAKVNEDASGDVTALQKEIQFLKGQLSSVMKQSNFPTSLSICAPSFEEPRTCDLSKSYDSLGDNRKMTDSSSNSTQEKKFQRLEATLTSSLRRERMTEATVQKLEAELQHMNRLACQREEDTQRIKMMLKFREEKIKQLELLVNGSVSAENYLMEENNSLKDEIQLLQARIDRNPEVTRFAHENIRLLERLQMFQSFYEHGERETLLGEVSELRDQLLEVLEGKQGSPSSFENQDNVNETVKELEDCKYLNSKLMREVNELQTEARKYLSCSQEPFITTTDSFSKDAEESRQTEKYSLAKTISTRSDSAHKITSYNQVEDVALEDNGVQNMNLSSALQLTETQKELTDAKILIEAMESEQLHLIEELQLVQEQNQKYIEILTIEDKMPKETYYLEKLNKDESKEESEDFDSLHAKLEKLANDLEEARTVNCQHQVNQSSQSSQQQEIDLVREEVEIETSRTILQLSEEVASLQVELDEKLHSMSQENATLTHTVALQERKLRTISAEWEKAILELTSFLIDGSRSVKDASSQIESIVCSLPQVNVWMNDHIEQAAKAYIEKEETILLLQKSLEDTQKMVQEFEVQLDTLKGATIALSELQNPESAENPQHSNRLSMLLNEKIETIKKLEGKLKIKEEYLTSLERNATAAFIVVQWLADHQTSSEASKLMKSGIYCPIMQQLKNEFAEAKHRLHIIINCINRKASICGFPDKDEDLIEADQSSDYSSSISDFSLESVSGNNSEDYAGRSGTPENMTEQIIDLKSDENSVLQTNDLEPKKLEKLLEKSTKEESMTFSLRNELEMAYDAFDKLYIRLTSLADKSACENCSYIREVTQTASELIMKKAEAGCHSTTEALADQKFVSASSFFRKFEEVNEAMKEADIMINTVMQENENAKQQNGVWRKAGKDLLAERASLIEEVEQLKSSLQLKEKEIELLRDQTHQSLVDIAGSVSLFEGYSQQLQKEVEDWYKVLYSDVVALKHELHDLTGNSRSSLEEIWSKMMENDFSLFVQHQCHIEAFLNSISNFNAEQGFLQFRENQYNILSSCHDVKDVRKGDESRQITSVEKGEVDLRDSDLILENLSLKKELQRKEELLDGLLFDFSMLQESASNTKDIKDKTEKLHSAFIHVRQELEMKSNQLHDLSVQQRELESHLADTENALLLSNSDIEQAKEIIDTLEDQLTEYKMLTKDLYLQKSEAEQQLEEHKEIVKGLEEEILHLTSLAEQKLISTAEDIEEDTHKIFYERNQLQEEVCSLHEKLQIACALADENEAIAVEARQESEASKNFAEQKEEEVKILEHSVEELERTINVLETKVNEMDDEIERHRLMRNSLEAELQALRRRLSAVENLTDIMDSENSIWQGEAQTHRQLRSKLMELHDAHNQIKLLEREKAERNKEIKQLEEYITELVLHSEAQASQFQEKYKILEVMVQEVKTDPSVPTTITARTLEKTDKSSTTRTRGSSSPFRCISSFVQQMNVEKDEELTMAKFRIEELEASVSSRQKEVCMLNTRLAAAESMTHDVIRDLLGVKLDMTNYANLIDHQQVQKLVEDAHQQAEDFLTKEHEALNLRKQIDDLTQERDSCISVMKSKEADIIAAQMTLEQLQERDQLLFAQNEMLKMDKSNLLKKTAELDEMVKALLGTQSTQQRTRPTWNMREKSQRTSKMGDTEFSNRLAHNEKVLSRVNDELTRYRKPSSVHSHDRTCRPASEQPRYR
ncbi:hypothetical protein ACFE04_006871 [Oxalis oulophora]